MQNLQGKISVLINDDKTRIQIRDELSRIVFCEVELTPEQLSSALSRRYDTECKITVKGLNYVGKKMEHQTFEFEIPNDSFNYTDKTLRDIAQEQLSDGWIADGYFDGKNSFFNKDGKRYARCTIRRWL